MLTPTDLVVDATAIQKIRKRLGDLNVVTVPGFTKPDRSRPRAVAESEDEYLPTLKSPADSAEAWLGT